MRQPRGFTEGPFPLDDPAARPVLADACAVIVFYHGNGAGMLPAGLQAMQGRVAVSPITLWELTHKTADGKLPQPLLGDASNWLDLLPS